MMTTPDFEHGHGGGSSGRPLIDGETFDYVVAEGAAVSEEGRYASICMPSVELIITRARGGRMTLVAAKRPGGRPAWSIHADITHDELVSRIIREVGAAAEEDATA